MYIFAELGGVVAEILLAYIYLNSFFPKRPFHRRAMGYAYTVIGIILALLSMVPNAAFLRLAFYATSIGGIAYFFYQAEVRQAIYASISYCMKCWFSDCFPCFILTQMSSCHLARPERSVLLFPIYCYGSAS